MTRAEQLKFCEKCLNRKMDPRQGLVCSLTNEKATFETECADFKLDERVPESVTIKNHDERVQDVISYLPDSLANELRQEQNFGAGTVVASIVGLIGAMVWGFVTVKTGYEIGYMSLAIGAGVGVAMRFVGKGFEQKFGITAAIIAFFSVLFGKFFSVIGFIANYEGLDFFFTLSNFNYAFFPQVMIDTFGILDVVFYLIAIAEGYKFAFRKITEEEIKQHNSID